MDKPAHTDQQLHPLIRDRWSPRAFSCQPIEDTALYSLLEAARWAPSCFNEQPWRFVVASRQDEAAFGKLLSCLNESNRRWAQRAGVLVLATASKSFARNGKPNRHALHDLGLAVAQLSIQATALGLRVHQMAGFSIERVRELYGIPDAFDPVTVIAIGYPGVPDDLPEDLRDRETQQRERKPLAEIAFVGVWDQPMPALVTKGEK
ncbi:MAG: nitroreductase family protein [Deltaproteobacteria bacterium]|nr:nitroreductase family protein [Deltaproteobacteria bacterium]